MVVISATDDNLDSQVDRRFGRCPWFLLVDTESLEYEAAMNESADASSGAGTACAQFVLEKGVDTLISGQVGPNAYEVLKQGGVEIFIAPKDCSIREAINKYKNNELQQMKLRVF